MGDFKYCKDCESLFTSYGSKLCPECLDKREEEFKIVRDYIWDNPGGNLKQVAEATEVDLEKIMQWLRDERLILKMDDEDSSFDSGLKCSTCGKNIRSGKFCDGCKNNLNQEMQREIGASKAKIEGNKPSASDGKDKMYTVSGRKS